MTKQKMFSIMLCTALILTCLAPVTTGEIPAPDHTFYGIATINAELVTDGVVTVTIGTDPEPVASYTLGAFAALGDRYALRIPLASGEPRQDGSFRPGDEAHFFLNGELAGSAIVGAPGAVTGLDLDPFFNDTPELSITGAVEIVEGDSGSTEALLTILLSRPINDDVSVDVNTNDGTAAAPGDYDATSERLTIAAGDTQVQARIAVHGDLLPEPPEDFYVELSNPANAVLANGHHLGVVTISADDAQFVLRIADTGILEADGVTEEAVFTVTVSNESPELESSGPVTVSYMTLDETAIVGEDYEETNGVLTIDTDVTCPEIGLPCGEIRVPILADNVEENDETFTVRLFDPDLAVIADPKATGTIFNDERFLVFVESQLDGMPGLDDLRGTVATTVSPDGAHVYAASSLDNAIVAFTRDTATGALTPGTTVRDGENSVEGLGGVEALSISPDGQHLYAAGFVDDAVAFFERDNVTGDLTFVESYHQGTGLTDGLDGAISLALSPDGLHLYVAGFHSNAIAVLERNPGNGTLTFVDVYADGSGGMDGLTGADAVTVSPDGEYVYVASAIDSAVVVLSRDTGTGELTFVELEKDAVGGVDGLSGATAVALSSDGQHLYVVGQTDNAIAVFARDPGSGELSFVQRKKNGLGGMSGLGGASSVAVAPDGQLVYVASEGDSALVVFHREDLTGELTLEEARRDGEPDPRGTVDGLAGGSGIALSPEPDGRHIYVAGYNDDGIAVFFKDTIAPDAPVVSSPSHTVSTWSDNNVLALEWTAQDNAFGVGLTGYSFTFDSASGTEPDIELEVLHDSLPDPQQHTETLADGSHYFHIRACDAADNCGLSAELGPFLIDTTLPGPPADLISTSHGTGVPSTVSDISMTWTAASDGASGLAGYAFVINDSSEPLCSQVSNLGAEETSVVVEDVPSGSWYFHLCSVDVAGNWSAPISWGPFELDLASPQMSNVDTVPGTADHILHDGELLSTGVTQLLLKYSEDIVGLDDVNAYRLVDAGANGQVDSSSCNAIVGDDNTIDIDHLTSLTPDEVALHLGAGQALVAGTYRFFACSDALVDSMGNPLDGDIDGIAGGDFVLDFTIGATNLVSNPNLDKGIDAWASTSTGDGLFVADVMDAGSAITSGSATWLGSEGPITALSQCIQLNGEEQLAASGRLYISSDQVDEPTVSMIVEVFESIDCSLPVAVASEVTPWVGDTGGHWRDLSPLVTGLPPKTRSALVSYVVTSQTPWVGSLFFDDLSLVSTSVLFADSFESGDMTSWSFTSNLD